MNFEAPLSEATLLRRYKRFLADVRWDDGTETTVHVANTGSMRGCCDPGSRVLLSHHPDKGRKLEWSLELIRIGTHWVCVNTAIPNRIVEEAILAGRIGPLRGYPELRREVPYGNRRSRIDLLLQGPGRRCYVEVKNVTLKVGRSAAFPDAVSERGTKHLRELMDVVRDGDRGVLVFLLNRGDCSSVVPAREIDPVYAQTLGEAADSGVELLAYRTRIEPHGIEIDRKVQVRL